MQMEIYWRPSENTYFSLFVWLWLVVNDHKFSAGTIFFSHTNQPAVLLYEPATIRTSQQAVLHPNLLLLKSLWFSIQSRYLLHAVGLMGSFSFLLFDFVFNGSLVNISWAFETEECNSHILRGKMNLAFACWVHCLRLWLIFQKFSNIWSASFWDQYIC